MSGFSFRRRALERVSSPEELDRLVKVALPRTWIALAGLGVLMLAADIAEGRLVPEPGWLPFSSTLTEAETGHPGMQGRLVALVPPFARRAWLSDPQRRPFLPAPPGAPAWFQSA